MAAQARAVEVHGNGERRIGGAEAHLLVERDELGPAPLAEIVLLEHAHGRVVGVIDLEDRLPAEQRRVGVAAQFSVEERQPLVGGDLGVRLGRVLQIGEREVGERGEALGRLQRPLERLARQRMRRPRLEGVPIVLGGLIGMAVALEPLTDDEIDGEARLGRLGIAALALERRQVRGRIVARVRDAIEPFAGRCVAGRARGGVGVGAGGRGGIAGVVELRGAEAQGVGDRLGARAGGVEARLQERRQLGGAALGRGARGDLDDGGAMPRVEGEHAAPGVDRLVVVGGEERALVRQRRGARLVAGGLGGIGLGTQRVDEGVGLPLGGAQDALLRASAPHARRRRRR